MLLYICINLIILNGKIYKYHLLFWAAIYLLWVLIFRSYSFSITKTMTVQFCYLVFITASYYAISSYIIPQFLLKKKYLLFVIAVVVVSALSAWLRALVAMQMNRLFFHAPNQPDFLTLYLSSLFNISFWVLLVTIGKMLVDRVQNQRQLELLETEKRKNELDFLKAQINPHALFNSLNTIYGYIDKSNQAARNVLLQFSELLRYQLYDCSSEQVSLGNEIAYIRNYIAFQQLRKDESLVVDMAIENIKDDLKIAPLLLVVLIENAFKFAGNANNKESLIVIRLTTENSILHCSVFNTVDPAMVVQSNNANGIGIANFKRRLALLYAGKYDLLLKEEMIFIKPV